MADDTLVKAAQAAYEVSFGLVDCLGAAWEDLPASQQEVWLDMTRAVLEAAGIGDQATLLEEAAKHVQDLCAMCRMWRGRFVDWPQCQETCRHGIWLTKVEAALQRAGKE